MKYVLESHLYDEPNDILTNYKEALEPFNPQIVTVTIESHIAWWAEPDVDVFEYLVINLDDIGSFNMLNHLMAKIITKGVYCGLIIDAPNGGPHKHIDGAVGSITIYDAYCE